MDLLIVSLIVIAMIGLSCSFLGFCNYIFESNDNELENLHFKTWKSEKSIKDSNREQNIFKS